MGELKMILEGLGFGFGISTWPELPASAGPEDPPPLLSTPTVTCLISGTFIEILCQ